MNTFKSTTKILIAIAIILFSNCKNKNDDTHGISVYSMVILNEGGYLHGNAEITLYNSTTKTSTQDVFITKNIRPLGDVGQSIYRYNNRYYIALNNSNKIEVTDMEINSVQVFENIEQPRYMAFYENKAYISSWANNGQIYVLDAVLGTVITTIATDSGPEKMLLHNNTLYVANGGGLGYANTVSVINILTDQLEKNITVGDNPKEIVLQDNNHIWVLNAGKYSADWTEITGKGLMLVNTVTGEIEKTFDIPSNSSELNSLLIKDGILYFNHSGVYKMSINSATLPAEPLINQYYNGIQFDDNKTNLYGFTGNWSTSGNVVVIDIQTDNVIETIKAGVAPRSIILK